MELKIPVGGLRFNESDFDEFTRRMQHSTQVNQNNKQLTAHLIPNNSEIYALHEDSKDVTLFKYGEGGTKGVFTDSKETCTNH